MTMAHALRSVPCTLLLLAATARATQPSWPIRTDVTYPPAVDASGGHATVAVTVAADASDVRLEISGSDGMRVEPDNARVIRIDALRAGESRRFDVVFRPGPGRSYMTVAAHARFVQGEGGSVRDFQFGSESPQQLAEHRRCVMQDADGTWIRVMGCDEQTPAAPTPAGPSLDVSALRRETQPGAVLRVEGYVVDAYRCPPCPAGAICKPCAMPSAIFVADAPAHARFSWSERPADVAAIAVDDPSAFSTGVRYRFEVRLAAREVAGAPDATLVGSAPVEQAGPR